MVKAVVQANRTKDLIALDRAHTGKLLRSPLYESNWADGIGRGWTGRPKPDRGQDPHRGRAKIRPDSAAAQKMQATALSSAALTYYFTSTMAARFFSKHAGFHRRTVGSGSTNAGIPTDPPPVSVGREFRHRGKNRWRTATVTTPHQGCLIATRRGIRRRSRQATSWLSSFRFGKRSGRNSKTAAR